MEDPETTGTVLPGWVRELIEKILPGEPHANISAWLRAAAMEKLELDHEGEYKAALQEASK